MFMTKHVKINIKLLFKYHLTNIFKLMLFSRTAQITMLNRPTSNALNNQTSSFKQPTHPYSSDDE